MWREVFIDNVFTTIWWLTVDIVSSRHSDLEWPEGGVARGDRGSGCAKGLLFLSPHPDVWSSAALAPRWTPDPHYFAAWLRKQGDHHIAYMVLSGVPVWVLSWNKLHEMAMFAFFHYEYQISSTGGILSFKMISWNSMIQQKLKKLRLYSTQHVPLFLLMSIFVEFKVRGLCGTLTWNQHDDFTTPEGDVENSVSSFAGKFTTEHCTVPRGAAPDPCTTYTQRRHYADTVCSIIHSHVFRVCIWHVVSVLLMLCDVCLTPCLSLIHTCSLSHSDLLGMSRRGGEGTLFPPLSVGGLRLCSTEGVSLHHPHCLRPTLCPGGCSGPLAQPHLLL